MNQKGHLHPVTIAVRDIVGIFGRMGFGVAYGSELEDDFHNFTGLNIPPNHPARGMQDTFWIKDQKDAVLRTHTTSVSVRELEKLAKEGGSELRRIMPGKVFRNEATDSTHEAQFYQVDGFAVGPLGTVTLAHLKGALTRFYREFLGKDAKIRFRPSFFGFTEPSVEVDVWFEVPGKEGRWLEVSGGGMFHPNVIRAAGLDPEKTGGFAFGGGLERLLMVKYSIPDVRLFYSGDIRFVYGFEEKIT
ncbi:MAG: phenylalanine--tRNA ligase subunit alpha [bacterium]|nr:phenylalanine--tRNA ligase subunit alpha [bacterium]